LIWIIKIQHDFGSFVRGDFFFGRSLLLEYLKVDPAAEDEYSIDPREKAKLTVVKLDQICFEELLLRWWLFIIEKDCWFCWMWSVCTWKALDSLDTKCLKSKSNIVDIRLCFEDMLKKIYFNFFFFVYLQIAYNDWWFAHQKRIRFNLY